MTDSKVPVTITYRGNGIQPPLYVAGSFSDPQWVPEIMECATGEDGANIFSKKLQVEPNANIQYKFRVGAGDWWILNEGAPTVTDNAGNRNNYLEAPPLKEPSDTETPSETMPEDQNEEAVEEHPKYAEADVDVEQPHPVTRMAELKKYEDIERAQTGTPEFAKIAAEVADSAALLDRGTLELGNQGTGNGVSKDLGSSSLPEVRGPKTGIKEPKDQDSFSTTDQDFANTAAEVADTAEELDKEEPAVDRVTAQNAYRTPADFKADIKDQSLDITGYSNDPQPVPLFAHECAGLYEDDEIPGVDESQHQRKLNHRFGLAPREEDFSDPTLEKFPSTREEIMSTVRKVETGLNVDQTSFEGIPHSPVVGSKRASLTDGYGDLSELERSQPLISEQQDLSKPRPQMQASLDDRSVSQGSLGCIAEGAEGEETEDSKADEIATAVEKTETADEAIQIAREAEGEVSATSSGPTLQSLITVSPSDNSNSGLLSPASDEDEAIVIKNSKISDKSTEPSQFGYSNSERTATPKPEEPSSPRKPPPYVSKLVEESDSADKQSKADIETRASVSLSPHIVVSNAEDIQTEGELSTGPSLCENGRTNREIPVNGNDQTDAVPSSTKISRTEEIESGSNPKKSAAATSSAVETGQSGGTMKKRPAAHHSSTDRSGTPISIPDSGRDAAKRGNWFSAFIRLIFVDLVGGFVSRLCGGRRKTLATAGFTTFAIAAAWYWNTKKTIV